MNITRQNPSTSIFFILFLGAVLTVGPLSAYAETLYVKQDGTKLQAAGSPKSKILATLNQGTSVTVVEKTDKFYKVSSGGKSGWIFKFKLTDKAPGGGAGDGDFLGALGGKQKMAANESSSATSIRGLSPMAEEHARKQGVPVESIQSVKQMETFKVTQEELGQFLSDGKLGEYAQ